MQRITLKDGTWNILAKGADREGATLHHLAHTTEGWPAKNGFHPKQRLAWIDNETGLEIDRPVY